jgi:hypothetical protein
MYNECGSWSCLAEKIGTSVDAYRKFAQGHAESLSEASLSVLIEKGLVDMNALASNTECQPLANWEGETISIASAAYEKGYGEATLRKWCKAGKLDYVRKGRKIFVCINEKYATAKMSKIGVLRKENAELKSTVERLRQPSFDFTSANNAKDKEIEKLQSKVASLKAELEAFKKEKEEKVETPIQFFVAPKQPPETPTQEECTELPLVSNQPQSNEILNFNEETPTNIACQGLSTKENRNLTSFERFLNLRVEDDSQENTPHIEV